MKNILQEIKNEINSLRIEDVDFNKLTFESSIIMQADLRQFLHKIKYISKKLHS